jgi:hypothetical protein
MWNRNKPETKGFYWMRNWRIKPTIVCVVITKKYGTEYQYPGDPDFHPYTYDLEWYGPIISPE